MKRTWKVTHAKNKQFKLNVRAATGGKSVATFGENLTKVQHAIDMAESISKINEMQSLRNTLEQVKTALCEGDGDVKYAVKLIRGAIKLIDKSQDKVVVVPKK